MRLNIHIDTKDIFDVSAVERAIEEEIENTAEDVKMTAKNLVPIDTGALRNSIDTTGSGTSYDIFAITDYARYIEYGTAPHVITGNPYLFWDPDIGPREEVWHPGNSAYLYMSTAFDSHTDDIDNRIADAIGRVL
jgi:hypothetical protein